MESEQVLSAQRIYSSCASAYDNTWHASFTHNTTALVLLEDSINAVKVWAGPLKPGG